MVRAAACLAGVRATDYRDGTDGGGEEDFAVCSERQQSREEACWV